MYKLLTDITYSGKPLSEGITCDFKALSEKEVKSLLKRGLIEKIISEPVKEKKTSKIESRLKGK